MPPINDDDYTDDESQDEERHASLPVKDLKALRRKARQADEMAPKIQSYERELAFAKAKLDFDDPKMKFFIKGYEGELNSEAIRQAALENGFLAPPDEQIPQDELRQHQRAANASAGAEEVMPEPDIMTKLGTAKNPDEIMKLLTAAGVPTTWNRE